MDDRLVLVVGFDGVELIDVACVTSAFDHANRQGAHPRYRVVLATPGGGPVRCDSGLALGAQERLDAIAGPVDTLVVSGGLGHELAASDTRLIAQVRRLAGSARRVASVCTGAGVLAAAGLLDRRRATTHWHYADSIAARFPRVQLDPEPVYVRDGHVSTSGGVTAALDLTLALVEEDHGAELTRRVSLALLAYLHRPGDQAQRSIFTTAPRGDAIAVRRVTDHVFGHLADALDVTTLAALVSLSPRHLGRLFVARTGRTPARYVRDARLEAAHQLVRTSDCGVARSVGRRPAGLGETLRMATDPPRRDRLRALLDSVLDDDHARLADMAKGAHSSPFHFSREVSRLSGEPPAAMRRRVMLERAAWRLRSGTSVTDAAGEAGYDSPDGFSRAFSRAFGCPPSRADAAGRRLSTPNGIHFHPPTSLWVDGPSAGAGPRVDAPNGVALLMVDHDVDDVRSLLDAARRSTAEDLRRDRCSSEVALAWGGRDDSILGVLRGLVAAKEVWLAAIRGEDAPDPPVDDDLPGTTARHETVAPRWLATIGEIDRRGGWDDRLVDALCDPPQSFVLGGVLAHVLTFSAGRRLLVRRWLRETGVLVVPTGPGTDDADPLNWLDRRTEGSS